MTENPFAAPNSPETIRPEAQGGGYSYRSTQGLATVIKVSIVVYCLGTLGIMLLNTIGTLRYPNFTNLEAEPSDQTEQLLLIGSFGFAVITVLVFLVAAVAVCMFMHRSNRNARVLGATQMEHAPGWSVGYWFIPILNLFRPYQAMKELYQSSTSPNGSSWRDVEPSSMLGPWWGCWLIGGMISRAVNRMESKSVDLGMGGVVANWIAAILLISGGVLLTMIVKDIAAKQHAAVKKLTG